MQPSRITLGQIMGMIGILGLVFAVSPAPLAIGFSVLLIALGGLSAFVRVSWFRLGAWAFSCYPLLVLASLYVTWWTAWYVLGHRPRPALDDPKSISPLVDAAYSAAEAVSDGALAALLVNLILAVIEFIRTLYSSPDDLRGFAARVAIPILLWPFAIVWIMADPGQVLFWFMD